MENIGISFGGGLDPRDVVECAKLADELGYDSIWITEGNGGDQFSILTACSFVTKTLRLGTSISSVFVRSAPTIAMAAACVDAYSEGRLILGLGSSHKVQVEGQHGITYSKPYTTILESVHIIRTLLHDESISYNGEVFKLNEFKLSFKPYRSEIPIYLAAVFPKMLKKAGELADGVILTQTMPGKASEARDMIIEGAESSGRRSEKLEIASLLSCYVTTNKDDARKRARESLAHTCGFYPRYNRFIAKSGFKQEAAAIKLLWDQRKFSAAAQNVSDEMVNTFNIIGDPDECLDRIENHRKAGITLPILGFRSCKNDLKREILTSIRSIAN